MSAALEINAYHSDAPISDPAEDAFDRWPFAQRIADTIASRTDPASLCIGIYGTWGEGKSTVLNFIEKQVRKHKNVGIIHFNPWRFRTEDDLFIGFFSALAGGIGGSLNTKRERAAETVAPYTKLLSPLSFGAFGVHISATDLAKNLKEAATADVETLKSRLDELIRETGKKLLVFVDDIDRMDRAQIHAVFKLIKACGEFLCTVYILAFDDKVVAAALGKEYGPGDANAGYDFLDKIVQVPLRLPAASGTSLRHYFLTEVDRVLSAAGVTLSEEEVHSFVQGFDRGFSRALTTPRMAKRYANALAFGLPLLAGEVNTVDFLLIEAMRIFFPSLHDFVKSNSESVLRPSVEADNRQATANLISSGIDTVEANHRDSARRLLLALFPHLQSVFGNMHYSSESELAWAKAKRVCAPDYFQRYFSYAIGKAEVSDRKIAVLCSAADQRDCAAVSQQFNELLSPETAESVLNKLYNCVDDVSLDAARIIATEFSRYGSVFSRRGGFGMFSPFARAAGLIVATLNRLPKGTKRLNATEQVLRDATPIGFAGECLSWLRAQKDTPDPDRMFSERDEQRLGRVLARRIRLQADCTLLREPKALLLLYVWHHFGHSKGPRALVHKCLQADPAIVTAYLRSAVGTVYASGMPPSAGDFDKSAYSAVLQYADARKIHAAVVKVYGSRLKGPVVHKRDRDADERIAHEFEAIYRSEVARKSVNQPTETTTTLENSASSEWINFPQVDSD